MINNVTQHLMEEKGQQRLEINQIFNNLTKTIMHKSHHLETLLGSIGQAKLNNISEMSIRILLLQDQLATLENTLQKKNDNDVGQDTAILFSYAFSMGLVLLGFMVYMIVI